MHESLGPTYMIAAALTAMSPASPSPGPGEKGLRGGKGRRTPGKRRRLEHSPLLFPRRTFFRGGARMCISLFYATGACILSGDALCGAQRISSQPVAWGAQLLW